MYSSYLGKLNVFERFARRTLRSHQRGQRSKNFGYSWAIAVACRGGWGAGVRRPRASSLGASNDPVFLKELYENALMAKNKRKNVLTMGMQHKNCKK